MNVEVIVTALKAQNAFTRKGVSKFTEDSRAGTLRPNQSDGSTNVASPNANPANRKYKIASGLAGTDGSATNGMKEYKKRKKLKIAVGDAHDPALMPNSQACSKRNKLKAIDRIFSSSTVTLRRSRRVCRQKQKPTRNNQQRKNDPNQQ